MGNCAAFAAFEQVVVAIYKRGKLDKEILADLMEPYRGIDIDAGGKEGLFVKEGNRILEVEDIVIKVMTGKIIDPPKLPQDHRTWTLEQANESEDYHELMHGEFSKITDKFGWR